MPAVASDDTSFVLPPRPADAVTRASVVDGRRGRDTQWQWYAGCIREMLIRAGCPTEEADDLTHDILIEKLERACAAYDPAKGRFRPYLYRVVQNAWRDRQRRRRPHGEAEDPDAVAGNGDGPSDRLDRDDDLRLLNLFFDRLFARFMHRRTLADVGFFLLRDWFLTGRELKEAIAAHGLGISPDHGRKLRSAAIGEFAAFVESHLNERDYALIADQALRDGSDCAQQARKDLIAGAFIWPSEKKRLGIVAAILRRIYLKEQAGCV